jgi:hypothetical protein
MLDHLFVNKWLRTCDETFLSDVLFLVYPQSQCHHPLVSIDIDGIDCSVHLLITNSSGFDCHDLKR